MAPGKFGPCFTTHQRGVGACKDYIIIFIQFLSYISFPTCYLLQLVKKEHSQTRFSNDLIKTEEVICIKSVKPVVIEVEIEGILVFASLKLIEEGAFTAATDTCHDHGKPVRYAEILQEVTRYSGICLTDGLLLEFPYLSYVCFCQHDLLFATKLLFCLPTNNIIVAYQQTLVSGFVLKAYTSSLSPQLP